jgi:hypothetical protein
MSFSFFFFWCCAEGAEEVVAVKQITTTSPEETLRAFTEWRHEVVIMKCVNLSLSHFPFPFGSLTPPLPSLTYLPTHLLTHSFIH